MNEKYSFTADIQKKIVAMLLKGEQALEENTKLIKPDYFDNPILKDLTRLIIGFYKKYFRPPTEDELTEEMDVFLGKEKKRNKNFLIGEYCDVYEEVLGLSQKDDFDYVRDKVKDFAQYQAMKQALLESGEKLGKKDYKGIEDSISTAIRAGEEREIALKLTSLDTIVPEKVDWLWFNRIPKGKLSLIVGDPGVGKSFITIFLAAHVTTGEPWPDFQRKEIEKGKVIILTAEDGLADTVRPRADAAGADVKNIKILEGTQIAGELKHFSLLRDIPRLAELLEKNGDIKLIVIDPLTAYLSGVDTHRDSDTRGVMAPLSKLAEKHKVTIVAVLHLNKNTAVQALYRVSGSMAFLAQARASWVVAYDPKAEGRRLFMPLKCNLSVDPNALAFRLEDNRTVFEEAPVSIRADDVLMERKESPREEAKRFLREILSDGEKPAVEIFELANEDGITQKTLKRAKKDLKIKSYQKQKKHWWKIPEEEDEMPTDIKEQGGEIREKHTEKREEPVEEIEKPEKEKKG